MSRDSLSTLDDAALARMAADLDVSPRAGGEDLEAFRVRVASAFNDDAAVDAAAALQPSPRPFVLGGMKLGG